MRTRARSMSANNIGREMRRGAWTAQVYASPREVTADRPFHVRATTAETYQRLAPRHVSTGGVQVLGLWTSADAGEFQRICYAIMLCKIAAFLYYYGQGVTKDLNNAAELSKTAADQGNAAAQNHLGWLYQNGLGVPKDSGKAVDLYQKAVNQGNAEAEVNLGLLYESGQGVTRDLAKATELY